MNNDTESNNADRTVLLEFLARTDFDGLCGGPALDLGRQAATYGITMDELCERTGCTANRDFMAGYAQEVKERNIETIVCDACHHHKDYIADLPRGAEGNEYVADDLRNDLETLEDETIEAIANMMREQHAAGRLAFCSSKMGDGVRAALTDQEERQRKADDSTLNGK
jgi:hypothetical protein